MQIKTVGYNLHDWQVDACRAWSSNQSTSPFQGTFEIFTGGGKTLIALSCLAEVSSQVPDLQAAIVVVKQILKSVSP